MMYLGDFLEDSTLHFIWSTNDGNGASITRSGDGTIHVYKDNAAGTEVTTGITNVEDFDSLTGIHSCTIDLSSAAFYAIGANYTVILKAATIDGQTVNAVLAHFSIENRFTEVDVTKWNGTAVATPDTAGHPKVTIKDGTGTGEIALTSGAIDNVTLVATTTTNTDVRGTDSAALASVCTEGRLAELDAGNIPTDLANIETDTGEIGTAGAGLTDLGGMSTAMKAEVESEANDALVVQKLDHLVAVADADDPVNNSIIAKLANSGATADWSAYVNTTDSLQAIRDRGDAEWATGASITDILNVHPLIPNDIDLADTATVRIGLGLTNALDDLPTAGEITPGTVSIDRKGIGGTSWIAVEIDSALSEAAGIVYFDEVFDSGSYVEGDSIRITFKNQKIVEAANDYEVSGSDGLIYQTSIRQTMRGTNSAALASVCTEGRLAELDAGNIPTDLSNIETDTQDIQVKVDRNADLAASRKGFHTWQGNVFYVAPVNGNDSSGDGSRALPYKTIQAAHDDLVTDSNHDVIILLADAAAGTPTHTVAATTTISKRYTFIRGPGRDLIITRTGNGNTIDITGDGVEISGFQIGTAATGSGDGVNITDADFHRIHHCWFLDTRGDGVHMLRCENTQVHDNHFDGTGVAGSGQGVHIVGTAGSSNDNAIYNNHFAGTLGDSVLIEGGTTNDTAIHHNDIHNAGGWAVNIGASSTDAQVYSNNFGNNSSGDVTDAGTTSVIKNNTQWLDSTTEGRSLDVTTTGAAGIDWNNVENPTTVINLSGTTIKTATDVETKIDTAQTDLDTITGTGGVLIGTDVMDRSGTLDVNTKTISNGAVSAAAIATDAVDADALATDALTEIQASANAALVANNLDHLAKTAVANNADMTTEVVDGTILSNIMSATSDTSSYTVADDSLEGISGAAAGDLTSIKGTSLTETNAGDLAGSFIKFFDVATPAKDINDVGAVASGGVARIE